MRSSFFEKTVFFNEKKNYLPSFKATQKNLLRLSLGKICVTFDFKGFFVNDFLLFKTVFFRAPPKLPPNNDTPKKSIFLRMWAAEGCENLIKSIIWVCDVWRAVKKPWT